MSCRDSCQLPQSKQCPFSNEVSHAQRLQGLGLMLGEVVHDLSNLLALGIGHADLALEEIPERDAGISERISLVKDTLVDCGDLCRSLLVYAGRSTGAQTVFSPSDLTRELSRLVRIKIPGDVDFVVETDFSGTLLCGDPSIVRQVVLNLVLNAVEALVAGRPGKVVLSVSNTSLQDGPDGSQDGGSQLRIMVQDNGCGMSEETQKRLGDPFFTTKLTGRGLGLAAVKQLVAAVDGTFAVESAVGAGSVFTVTLPTEVRVPESEEAADALTPQADRAHGAILLVDDEESLLRVHAAILEKAGFEVLRAAHHDDAMMLFEKHRDDIGLIFLDMLLTGSDGATLSVALRDICGEVPIVLLSGCSEGRIEDSFVGIEAPVAILTKPVSSLELRTAAMRWCRLRCMQ